MTLGRKRKDKIQSEEIGDGEKDVVEQQEDKHASEARVAELESSSKPKIAAESA